MLQVEIPVDTEKLKQQIEALKYQIEHDISLKDKCIHRVAYERLMREYTKQTREE